MRVIFTERYPGGRRVVAEAQALCPACGHQQWCNVVIVDEPSDMGYPGAHEARWAGSGRCSECGTPIPLPPVEEV